MSGYTPIFSGLFQGSLCGKYPDLYVWLVMLGLSNRHGEVDCHPNYIATVAGITPALVLQAISSLCEPDPQSRTPDNEGRRLEPLPGRGFGWLILNHAKYREQARKSAFDAARTADGRNADRMRDRRVDPTRPAKTREDPPSYSDSNTDLNNKSREVGARKRASRLPEDWKPSEVSEKYAEELGLDPAKVLVRFADYWRAAPGSRGLKADWDATWRTWCRTAAERGQDASTQPAKKKRPQWITDLEREEAEKDEEDAA